MSKEGRQTFRFEAAERPETRMQALGRRVFLEMGRLPLEGEAPKKPC
jgi:hypothetical protein